MKGHGAGPGGMPGSSHRLGAYGMKKDLPVLPKTVADMLRSPERLAALHAMGPLPTFADPDFDAIVDMAAALFDVPVSLVTLVDKSRQWFQAAKGTTERNAPSTDSFCIHTLAQHEQSVLVVADATLDQRFHRQPRVVSSPFLRFYAGATIVVDGQPLGTVCVFDVRPRHDTTPAQLQQLERLAKLAASLFKLKDEARKRAIAADLLSKEERRHAMALDAANVGSWMWDIESGVVVGNQAMRKMFQLPESGPVMGRDIFSTIHHDDRQSVIDNLKAALREGQDYDSTFRIKVSDRWILGRGRVSDRDAKGRPLTFIGINIDVTEEHERTRHMRLLLRELNHRVKNTLAMLQSMARQTLRQTRDPREFMKAFAGRLQAISEAHGLLSDHEWGAVHLKTLIQKQLAPHVSDFETQVEIHKDEVELGPDQALGLGLVLHELATNADKYGALSVEGGKVVITARVMLEDKTRVLNMTWTEVDGPPVEEPQGRGFGSILIERSLDKVLNSSVSVEYLPAGLTALIRLPL